MLLKGQQEESRERTPLRFIQLVMAFPGSKAEVDKENAVKFYDFSGKLAKESSRQSPSGFLAIPVDLQNIPGGKPSLVGGEPYLIEFEELPLAEGIPPAEMTGYIEKEIDRYTDMMIEKNNCKEGKL